MNKEHKQYSIKPKGFDGYNKQIGIQEATGSKRAKDILEASELSSTNWKKGVSGWRLTPRGLELGLPVADGVYVVGNRITPITGDLGTITIQNGLIVAIQQAT